MYLQLPLRLQSLFCAAKVQQIFDTTKFFTQKNVFFNKIVHLYVYFIQNMNGKLTIRINHLYQQF